MFSLFLGPSAIYNAFCSGASETGITRYTAPAAPSCKAEVKGRLSPPPLGASPMCASCTVGLQAVCRDGTLTIFASCCTPVTPGCFPTDVAHHTSGMWRWQGESSCWGCGGEQLAAASALQPGGMLAGDVGDGKEEMPPRKSWATMFTFLQAHLPLVISISAKGFDSCRQMPGRFNPAGLGAVRQGIATPTFNHLSKCQVSLAGSG